MAGPVGNGLFKRTDALVEFIQYLLFGRDCGGNLLSTIIFWLSKAGGSLVAERLEAAFGNSS